MGKAAVAAVVGCILCVGVAINEWHYHQTHRFAPGPSGVIAVLGIAGALTAGAVAYLAFAVVAEEQEREQRFWSEYRARHSGEEELEDDFEGDDRDRPIDA